jgi:hypothetical protein
VKLLTKLFLLPLFLHVVMIFWIGSRTLSARIRAVRNGSAKLSEVAADSGAWPRKVRLLGNNFDNQFDTPTLWYAVSALVFALQMVDWVFVGLSWVFIFARIGHSYVHTGTNDVPTRMRVFLFGLVTLLVMWAWLGAKVFLGEVV